MALTNRDRIERGLSALREGLTPYVESALGRRMGKDWAAMLDRSSNSGPLPRRPDGAIHWDVQRLLKAMADNWASCFKADLSLAERGFVNELSEARNRWAHEHPFTSDDVARALDTAQRLLLSIGAKTQAEAVYGQREDLKRTVMAEVVRNKTRYATLPLEGVPQAGLKPWREVATPHRDVASGEYRKAEFAANLGHVHTGRAGPEYADPAEFYARTFLTEGLSRLLRDAARRLAGLGGEPVVSLQTQFGGGKTHSMLALYHLVRAARPQTLPGVADLLATAGIAALPRCGVAVLVGTDLAPAEPRRKPDGTVVRTLWGELAWQLGDGKAGSLQSGAEAFELVAASDAAGTSPGTALGEVLSRAAPCLVLVDEWVAFVRQLLGRDDLPAGGFDANMTFAQSLTEQVAGTPGALLVASLPESDIETGGDNGRTALRRLGNVVRRVENSWSPATPAEGFEIVRRRLFEPLTSKQNEADRAATVHAFGKLYAEHKGAFPRAAAEPAYLRRMEAAYPIHPALFATLFEVWSPLPTFQQTRGVLRLISDVVHQLWEAQDKGLLIMPASVPLDGPVGPAVLQYLGDGWSAVVEKDVDGQSSTARRVDAANTALARYSATRRVARATFLGSAPTASVGQNPGLDERDIRLASVQPGETPGTFDDALRRLADHATYLYKDGPRHWFASQPNVNRLAHERAEAYDEDLVEARLAELVREHVRASPRDAFAAVHACPASGTDVPDEPDARLVVLGPGAPHSGRGADTLAVRAAEEVLRVRNTGQRNHRNALVFLAPDAARLGDMKRSVRMSLAWDAIWDERELLKLGAFELSTAKTRREEAARTVQAQLGECWRWLLAPQQPDPMLPDLAWTPVALQGADLLPVRAARRLAADEGLITSYGPQRLRDVMDRFHLWGDGPHVGTAQLWEYFSKYPYLPRLQNAQVLAAAITRGLDLAGGTFGYAAAVEPDGRYLDLTRTRGPAEVNARSVLLRPEAATRVEAEQAAAAGIGSPGCTIAPPPPGPGEIPAPGDRAMPGARPAPLPRRYFASVDLQPDRAARDFGTVATEVLAHLVAARGTRVKVRLEIEADAPTGFAPDLVRLVSENGSALRFTNNVFETDGE